MIEEHSLLGVGLGEVELKAEFFDGEVLLVLELDLEVLLFVLVDNLLRFF